MIKTRLSIITILMGDTAIVIDNIEVSPIGMSSRNMNKASSVERECPICLIETNQWREMPCCNNNLCPTCYDDWHGNSQNPTCVFCRYDDIEYVNSQIVLRLSAASVRNTEDSRKAGGWVVLSRVLTSKYSVSNNPQTGMTNKRNEHGFYTCIKTNR